MKGLDESWSSLFQIVVPLTFRSYVLTLAHNLPWSWHLGFTKTYLRVLQHFLWPGLKKDVAGH